MTPKKKPKTPCKKCVPDPNTRKSHLGQNGVTDTYRCERCGKVITRKPW